MSNGDANAAGQGARAASKAIESERIGCGDAPMLVRPDRELIPDAVKHGILRTREIDGVTTTVVDSRGSGTNRPLRRLIVQGMIMNVEALGGDLVAGVANSGTLWAGLVGYCAGLDFCNVRIDGPRRAGFRREIEPDGVAGRRVVLVDNYVRSGESLQKAEEILIRHGAEVVGMAVISAPTDYVSFTSSNLDACPLRIMWPKDLLQKEVELTFKNIDTTY